MHKSILQETPERHIVEQRCLVMDTRTIGETFRDLIVARNIRSILRLDTIVSCSDSVWHSYLHYHQFTTNRQMTKQIVQVTVLPLHHYHHHRRKIWVWSRSTWQLKFKHSLLPRVTETNGNDNCVARIICLVDSETLVQIEFIVHTSVRSHHDGGVCSGKAFTRRRLTDGRLKFDV